MLLLLLEPERLSGFLLHLLHVLLILCSVVLYLLDVLQELFTVFPHILEMHLFLEAIDYVRDILILLLLLYLTARFREL